LTLKQCIIIYTIIVIKICDKQKFVYFSCLLVFISILFIGNGYLFYLFFVVKNNAVQYHSDVKWCPWIWTTLFVKLEPQAVAVSP